MTIVAKILEAKPSATVHTIAPSTSVLDALRLMADKDIGALVVTEDDAIVGIFTERDYARKIALLGRTSWRRGVGGFIVADGWLGDAAGMRPHGLFICGEDPATGGVAFWHFGERADIARGHVRRVDDGRVALDWTINAPGENGTPAAPEASRARTTTWCVPSSAAKGDQLMRPLSGWMLIPAGPANSSKVIVSPSGSRALTSYV